MHAHVLYIVLVHFFIGLSCQTCQTILIQEDSKWVDAKHEHVDSEVELQTLDQKWLVQILLDHTVLS
jgi:hypothetical protein